MAQENLEASWKYQMPFGKHKNLSLREVWEKEPTYLTEFLRGVTNLREPLKKHVLGVLAHIDEGDQNEEPSNNDGILLDR